MRTTDQPALQREIRIDVPKFWDQGYAIVRNVFSRAEIDEFRRHGFDDRQRLGDLLSHPHLRNCLLDDHILDIASQILEDKPVYYGDSTFNFGQSAFDFHKDNPDRLDGGAPDWNGKYTQIRFGIYLQDHAWRCGGLRVIPASHKALSNQNGKPVNVRTRVGDVVVWNLRIDHAGAASMVRLLPWMYVEMRGAWAWKHRYLVPIDRPLPMRLPRILLAEGGPERAAMFFTLGREDAHLERYIAYLKTRAYAIDTWKNSEYGPDVWDAVRGKNIKVIDIGAEVRRRLAAGDTSLGLNKGHAQLPY
jgi:hypothetical protein